MGSTIYVSMSVLSLLSITTIAAIGGAAVAIGASAAYYKQKTTKKA